MVLYGHTLSVRIEARRTPFIIVLRIKYEILARGEALRGAHMDLRCDYASL